MLSVAEQGGMYAEEGKMIYDKVKIKIGLKDELFNI